MKYQYKYCTLGRQYFARPSASENIPTLGSIYTDILRGRVEYIAYYTSKSGIWLVISRVASYFHEPKASANTAYE